MSSFDLFGTKTHIFFITIPRLWFYVCTLSQDNQNTIIFFPSFLYHFSSPNTLLKTLIHYHFNCYHNGVSPNRQFDLGEKHNILEHRLKRTSQLVVNRKLLFIQIIFFINIELLHNSFPFFLCVCQQFIIYTIAIIQSPFHLSVLTCTVVY